MIRRCIDKPAAACYRNRVMNLIREILKLFLSHFRRCAVLMAVCFKEIFRLLQDCYYDKKLGIQTCYDYNGLEERPLYKDEIIYKPTSFHRIRLMLNYLKLDSDDVLVDFGCGKGRVLTMAALLKLKKVVGIEIRKTLADAARRNLSRLKGRQTEAAVICGDAVSFDPIEGNLFFMYDPFLYKTFTHVLGNIRESLLKAPRNIRIVYFDGRYSEILDNEPWLRREGEIGHTKIFVWRN
jgi:SAM-dependent methyltransferase